MNRAVAVFALVEVNNLYVSCRRVFRPALIGRPVAVLPNSDGACIARSNEAKDIRVKMAQPWFQVRHPERLPGLIALSAIFELYGDVSSRMMSFVVQRALQLEVYSIPNVTVPMTGPSTDTRVIISTAVQALHALNRTGHRDAKVGVMLVELQPEGQHQGRLDQFAPAEPAPEGPRVDPARLMGAVDLLNRRFRCGTVNLASAGHQTRNGDHSGKQTRCSPRHRAPGGHRAGAGVNRTVPAPSRGVPT